MGKVIVIVSGKGGVGKTISAINLGMALNELGKDVTIVDANLTTPNVGLHLGAPIVPVTLNHVLKKRAKIAEAIYEHESGTKIIPSSISFKEIIEIDSKKLKNVVNELKKVGDYVILDSAAGLGKEALIVMEVADDIIIVTNPDMPSVTDALRTIKLAEKMGKNVKGIIITRVKKNYLDMPFDNVKNMLEYPVLGIIPEDISVQESINKKNAVLHTHPKSKAAKGYRYVASKIADLEYSEPRKSFFARLFGL